MLKACRCYGLATAEIDLMWQTAPPRHAYPAARNMINSPAKGLKWGGECGNFTQ